MADRQHRPDRVPRAASDSPRSSRSGRIRCAIYTRKSSEEGLEQEFNSLDAQREACEAYVRSQKHEGWSVLPQLYDDPGFSGGNMERPALKRLLSDVAAHKVDVVVVYKVDRLTRSLADFAKIVEVFDAKAVSFVSITQAFNTTTSMGRLTLNVLLSFAQFEREVTGERIRDKIAASKKKGLWMGGQPALGYDVKDRKLVANEAEAETVQTIFRRYLNLGSVRELKATLDADGVVSKRRTAADGRPYGGSPFPAARSTRCCRTASIAARSSIKGPPIQGNTRRSSTRTSGGRFRRNCKPTVSSAEARATRRSSSTCSLASCSTPRADS
jgi:site-specific DNA recombinase